MLKDIKTNGPRLARLSIIHLGDTVKKTVRNKKGQPVEMDVARELPHFVLNPEEAADVIDAYGEQPTELLIYLPFPAISQNFSAYHELWGGMNTCLCRGDGETILDMLHPHNRIERVIRDGQVVRAFADGESQYAPGDIVPCPGLEHSYPRCAECKPVSRLIFLVRDPARPTQLVADRLGYYQISTRSIANYRTLSEQLAHVFDLAQKMNPLLLLQGIPIILKRVEREMSYIGQDKQGQPARLNTRHYLLELEFDLRWVQMVNERLNRMALGEGEGVLSLPEPIDPATGEIAASSPDVVDSTATEVEEPEPPPGNGNGSLPTVRPYPPQAVKLYLDDLVRGQDAEKRAHKMEVEDFEKLAGRINRVFDDTDHWLCFLDAMFGVQRMSELTAAQGNALWVWAGNQIAARREIADVLASVE